MYISETSGLLHAINPDGSRRWAVDALRGQDGTADEGPIAIFSDGTILVATNPLGSQIELVAFNSDGSMKWFHSFDGSVTWLVGPNIGPDGIAYVIASGPSEDDKVIALNSDGELILREPADPPFYEQAAIGGDLCFLGDGSDLSLVFFSDQISQGLLYTLDVSDGVVENTVPINSVNDPFQQHLQ